MTINWNEVRFDGGRLCLDFLNTVSDRTAAAPRDYFGDLDDLREWLTRTEALPAEWLERIADDLTPQQRANLLQQAVALRELLYALFAPLTRYEALPAPALAEFNGWLSRLLPYRHLVAGGESVVWEWHWAGSERPERLLWTVAWSAAELLTGGRPRRIKACPSCGWLFYDQSKNASRNWCSMEVCGSISKARRYYRKKKKG